MVLICYMLMTIWFCFWVGLMYTQPNRPHNQKIRWILSWALIALIINQGINHGLIYLLPDDDPIRRAYLVMYLFSASSVVTAIILWIGLIRFKKLS